MWGLSLVVASGGHSSLQHAGLSPSRPLPLRSTGSRRAGSAIVAHGPSRSAACGILPDQGSNACPLHWQADSQPLRHPGSPCLNLTVYRNFWYIQDTGPFLDMCITNTFYKTVVCLFTFSDCLVSYYWIETLPLFNIIFSYYFSFSPSLL